MGHLKGIEGGKSPRARRQKHPVSMDPADGEARATLSEFSIPAQDSHGHSAKVISRITPAMQRQISLIVETNPFQWETASDFIRWCIFDGQRKVTEYMKNPEITSMMALINSWVAAARVQQEHLKFTASLEVISGVIADLINKGAEPPAKKIVQEILEQVETVEDLFWRKRFEEEIRGKFGFLLKKRVKK